MQNPLGTVTQTEIKQTGEYYRKGHRLYTLGLLKLEKIKLEWDRKEI